MTAVDPVLALRISLAVLAGLGAYRFLVPSARRRSRIALAARLVHDAAMYAKQGDARKASEFLDRVLDMLAALEPEARAAALPVLVSVGQLGSRLARDERGPARLARAQALAVEWSGRDSDESLALIACVAAMHLGRPGEALLAEAQYRAGYDTAARKHGREAPQTVYWSSMRAHALWLAAKLPEAEAVFREVLRVVEKLPEPDPDQLWRARCSLAAVVEARGRFAEARDVVAGAVARMEGQQPPDRAGLAERLGRLGWLHFELASYAEAEACFKRALSLAHQIAGESKEDQVHRARAQLAVLYSQQARYDEAEAIYEELVAASTALWTDVSNYAETKLLAGRLSDARGLFERALTAARRESVPEPDLRDTLRALGDLALREAALPEAEGYYTRALAAHDAVHGRDHPHSAAPLAGLGSLRLAQSRPEEAEAAHREALALREKWLGRDHPDTATSLIGLALVLESTARTAEARDLVQRALSIRRATFPPDHPAIVETHAAVARLER